MRTRVEPQSPPAPPASAPRRRRRPARAPFQVDPGPDSLGPPGRFPALPSAAEAPGPLRTRPRARRAEPLALARQGVEGFRVGHDAQGRAEAHLRVRCPEGVVEAHLRQDGAGGVEVTLLCDADGALAQRAAAALQRGGRVVSVETPSPASAPADAGQGHFSQQPPPRPPRPKTPGRSSRQRTPTPLPRRTAPPGTPTPGGVDYRR